METIRACARCGRPLPKKHRKYCGNCSPLADVTAGERATSKRPPISSKAPSMPLAITPISKMR